MVTYFVFKVVLASVISSKVQIQRSKYSLRKVADTFFWLVLLFSLSKIWIESPQTLLVSYGLIAAGVAVSLQDLFKNFVGGFLILVQNIYKAGDRIEIDGKYGDVIDVGLFYTSVFEIRNWIGGDQSTGRITLIPNGGVLTKNINNYTKDHEFIWDEFTISFTYDSDIDLAMKEILKITKKRTKAYAELATNQTRRLKEKYYFVDRKIEPVVYVDLQEGWVNLSVRYVVHVKERREAANDLKLKILQLVKSEKKLTIGNISTVLDIEKMPPIKIKK